MRLWSIVLAVVFSPLLAIAADQQQPAAPQAGETIEVSIVNLDVVVTDKRGNRVHGLTRDDFEIFEDGKPQAITNFAEYGADVTRAVQTMPGSAALPAPAVAEAPPPQKRTIVVFVDRFKMVDFRRDPIFDSIKKLLHGVVRPGDAVSIVSWRGQPITRQDFTDDLTKLDTTLDAISKESEGVVGANALADLQRDIIAQEEFEQELLDFANGTEAGGSGLHRSASLGAASGSGEKPPPLDAYAAAVWAKVDLRRKVNAINSLLTGMSGAEGKKVLLLASHRLSIIAGLEYLGMGLSGPVPAPVRGEFSTETLVKSIGTTANAAGVTVYPIYPEGLGEASMQMQTNVEIRPLRNVLNLPASTNGGGYDYLVLNNELPTLSDIAKQTGGMSAFGSDIVKLLPRVEKDFGTYYSMAYKATTRREDRTRKLEVRTKNPAYQVRTRREMVEKSDATQMRERVVSNLFTHNHPSRIAISTKLGTAKKVGGKRWKIPLTVTIPVSSLTTLTQPNGDFAGSFSVYVAWGGILGEISETTHRVQNYVIPRAEAEKAAESTFSYDFELLADERTDRISVGVMDEVGKDSGYAFLRLPPRNQLVTEAR
jgi:VWFA-related protein